VFQQELGIAVSPPFNEHRVDHDDEQCVVELLLDCVVPLLASHHRSTP